MSDDEGEVSDRVREGGVSVSEKGSVWGSDLSGGSVRFSEREWKYVL